MAPSTLPPSPSPLRPVKREPDGYADGAISIAHTPRPPSSKKRRFDRLLATTTQPLLSPQTIPSGSSRRDSLAGERSWKTGLTPKSVPTSVKRDPDAEADTDGSDGTCGRPVGVWDNFQPLRPAPAEPPTLWVNRHRLGRLLHELARTHQWRDAAGVFSTLVAGTRYPESFEETRSMFVVGMEIHRRLADDSGMQQGTRSRYYLRTQKLYDVWIRRQIWLATCAEKHLVKLELALFYLSQGNIDNAYNTTRTLIAQNGLQTEPTLNLIHGLISYDKWYSGLPKDMQLEEFDVYSESCAVSMATHRSNEKGQKDSSDGSCSIDVDSSLPGCSSESSINNSNIDKNIKIPKKSGSVHSVEEIDSFRSQVDEKMVDTNFQSIFFNTSNIPTCGLEKSLLPLRLKHSDRSSNDCFDSYWTYKSTPNAFYEDAEKCLRVALYSTPPVMAALLPLIQILLLGDKLKDALAELEKICHSSTTALPFRLRGRLLEYFDQNQVSIISSCYAEALRIDPTCSYSMERLTKLHRKGYYNTIQLLDAITSHLDSVNGKPCIWEELVSCFLRLFSDCTSDYGDCMSCNVQRDATFTTSSNFSCVFWEQHTRETWKVRCRWWMNHHFSHNICTSETLTGTCLFLKFSYHQYGMT
ncbi:hypothetical protein GUJ93_ZPchr0012g19932 [Zizania palustris]|uniref:Uncharacterized protein n=1 Tax=Zizania palustris TaxID=103762 RepID=A0A8J6BSQ8_ZIZPA|nr:hypothetical protein GUJ93_ZPchr0012g19932 [Zizania palustris]